MKYFIGAISAVVVIIIVFVLFIYSGVYNISARSQHDGLSMWVINTLTENSIKNKADDDIQMPDLEDSSLIRLGFSHYKDMCVGCHGAPGIESLAKGFYPEPPLLTKTAGEWTPQQLFWIIKNGIKMTAMPAFGVTHNDQMIWGMAAFTKELPKMTADQYQYYIKTTKETEKTVP